MDLFNLYNKLHKYITQDRIKKYEPMNEHTSFRIGGPADLLVLPKDYEEIKAVVNACKEEDVPFIVIGNGTNLLVTDKGVRGVVIKLSQNFNDISVIEKTLRCKSGVSLSTAVRVALENSLSGLEFANGIPGSIGGAAVMNAGAYGGQMSDIVKKVKVLGKDGCIYEISHDDLEYSYRHSILQKGDVILLEVEMELKPGNSTEIKKKMDKCLGLRKEKQPLTLPSAGSTFKRPSGNYAGYLIEKAGLKGFRVGDAMVSNLHAGFIVNIGNATSADAIQLIDHIQKTVKQQFNIELEPEIKILGE
jgi:UDP-N-acetylmuramate dehydrogenase